MRTFVLMPIAIVVLFLLATVRSGAAEEPVPFDYFENSWSVLGLADYANGTRMTPDNRLQLADETFVRFCFGRNLTPLSRQQTKTLLDGWLPIVLLQAEDESVRYEWTLWAAPLPSATDWQKAFDGPVEGEDYANWGRVQVVNSGVTAAEARLKVQRLRGSTSSDEDYCWSLAPGESATAVVRIPFSARADHSAVSPEEADLWLSRTADYWRGLLQRTARIEVPCRKATDALRAAHVCQMITCDHGVVHGGEGFYDEFYIRDGAYQVMQLEEAGLWDATRKTIDAYLAHQQPDGRFESQQGQFDANGQALWTLWQYYKITGDRAWLAQVYPQMRRAVEWMQQARRQAPADSPWAGLLPNTLADGEFLWDGKYHIVGYDFWNLRGLLCTADAARALNRPQEVETLMAEAADYRKAIDAAWRRTGLPHFPPSWEQQGTHWGNTETLWPTELFDRDDPRVVALVDEVRQRHGGGFTEGTIRWLGTAENRTDAIHPYMSAYTTMTDLVRGLDQQVVDDFCWYLFHSTATHAFPEGVFPQGRRAWGETIPHGTGASNYAILLRHMLVHERGEELHLLAAVPDDWLAPGREIRIERAPTHFGPMSLIVRGEESGVRVTLDRPTRQPPAGIILHLPEARPLLDTLEGVQLLSRPNQTRGKRGGSPFLPQNGQDG